MPTEDSQADFYVLRYYPGTDVKDAKHEFTTGRHPTWLAAEEARAAVPDPWASRLEVVGPRAAAGVGV